MSLSNSFLQQSQIRETHRVSATISIFVFLTFTSNKSHNQALHPIAALRLIFSLCIKNITVMVVSNTFHICAKININAAFAIM